MLSAPLANSCGGMTTQHRSFSGVQLPLLPSRHRVSSKQAAKVSASKQSEPEQQSLPVRLAGPAAAALLASMLLTAAVPTEALAARSGGRAGGSSFRSAPRAMPRAAPSPRAAPAPSAGPSVRNYNYNNYSAPPLGGYGYGGGFGGFGGFSPFGGFRSYSFIPIGGGSGIFTFFFTLIAASAVINVVKSIGSKRRDDDFE